MREIETEERERLLRQMLCPEEREKGNVDEDVGQWLGNDFSLLAVVISCLKVCHLKKPSIC